MGLGRGITAAFCKGHGQLVVCKVYPKAAALLHRVMVGMGIFVVVVSNAAELLSTVYVLA